MFKWQNRASRGGVTWQLAAATEARVSATGRAETVRQKTPVATHAPLPGATGPQGSSAPGDRLWCVLCVL